MDVLESGIGEALLQDVDEMREWMRDKKTRALEDKTMDEHEAVRKYVHDGDYISYDLSSMVRGPMSIEREVVRQKRKDLWIAAKFTLLDTTLLVGGACVSKIDVGFAGLGRPLFEAIENGSVKTIDWSNGTLALRHLAGSMGVPFLPARSLLGTDTFRHSGAKVVEDPFTGKKIALVPAINPDVAIIHVNQCDVYGNARVYGPSITPLETAAASKNVILSTEEIISTEEIRKDPGKTTIPYYMVNAVVVAPYGAHPGTVPGYYSYDSEHLEEFFAARSLDELAEYIDKYVHSTSGHEDYMEMVGGEARMEELKEREWIKEGYY